MPALTRKSLVALMMATTVACAMPLGGCSDDLDTWIPSESEHAPYYDVSRFSESEGRYTYDTGSSVVSKTGVDVSEYQGDIDWHAAAADGISFAILRIGYRGTTEGGLFADANFGQNLSGAREAGIECGAYFYSQAISEEEALEEASITLERLGGTKLEHPVVYDYEFASGTRAAETSSDTATACVRAFCDAVRAGGYEVMLYGNAYDLQHLHLDQLTDIDLWLAQYGGAPTYTHPYAIWQYTHEGVVDGIGSGVDLNLDLSEAQ